MTSNNNEKPEKNMHMYCETELGKTENKLKMSKAKQWHTNRLARQLHIRPSQQSG